jgi:4-amino-4-deoxy-L-arabinose transferase-like glycosyltransferase
MLLFLFRKFGRADPWLAYVLIWGLVPPLFFTLARQVLYTYVLPGLPGLAIATAVVLERWLQSDAAADLLSLLKWHVAAIGCLGVAAAITAAVFPMGHFGLAPVAVLGAAALTVLVIAAVGWLALAAARRQDGAALTAIVGLAMAVAFTAVVFLLGSWKIDEPNSAKTILAEVAKDPAARQRTIAAPLGESTFSASFYVDVLYHGRFDHFSVQVKKEKGKEKEADEETARQLLDRPQEEILLLKRSDWDRLKPRLETRLVLVAETAHWVACQRRP